MIIDIMFRGYSWRMIMVMVVMLSLMLVLGVQCWNLQLRRGHEHVERIRRFSIRKIRIPPIRGRILSSDGVPFTDNQPCYDVYFHIHELRKRTRDKTVRHIQDQINRAAEAIGRPSILNPKWSTSNAHAQRDKLVRIVRRKAMAKHDKSILRKEALGLLGTGSVWDLSEWLVREKIRLHIRQYPAWPMKAYTNLSEDELARLQELMPGIPGMEISTNYRRIYPQRDVGAHIIGYVGKRQPKDFSKADKDKGFYYFPESIGKQGLERQFDKQLAGEVGFKTVRVDSIGYYHEQAKGAAEAVPGKDLILTIDSRAQILAQRLLEGRRGALVCVDVHSGAIIALVSSPSYDLDRLRELYSKWATDSENRPLNNRALLAGWTPGSIVKPLVGLSIIEKGIAHYDTHHTCIGYYSMGSHKVHCHNRGGHGDVNLLRALEVSCNPYFIKMGLELGIDNLTEIYEAAGVGKQTGVELRSRYFKGKQPSRQVMRETYGRSWRTADTAHVSIGQGFIAISPLHAAVFTAAIANGGRVYRPFLVRAIRNSEGKTVFVTRRRVVNELPASQESLRIVRAGMYKVVHGAEATGRACKGGVVTIAGKTGTAEMGTRTDRWNNTWFASFAPFESPKYAVVVFVEHGKGGGSTCAPIARAFYDRYIGLLREARAQRVGVTR